MTAAVNPPIALVDLSKLDVNAVVEIFKLLSKLLGPDFATNDGSKVAGDEDGTDTKHPFRLTITAAQQHHVTDALLRQRMVEQMDVVAPAKRRRVSEEGDSLHAAAKRNDVRAVLNLLQQHHNPYEKDANGRLPIQLATSKVVWEAFATKMHSVDQSFFLNAVEDDDGVATRLLLAAGADPAVRTSTGETAVHLVVAKDQTDVLKALLDSVGNCKYLFELTVKAGSNDGDLTPLDFACFNGPVGTVRILLERGAAVKACERSYGMQPLHFAVMRTSGETDVAKLLLDHGANVLATDSKGRSALHYAALLDHGALCEALLEKDPSNLNARDRIAASSRKADVVNILLDHGADVLATDRRSWTPLHIAANNGFATVCEAILEKDLTILDAQDKTGQTALHKARRKRGTMASEDSGISWPVKTSIFIAII
ncbi:hypothetical protein HDU96_007805 [Phlyctochytrium bullatum]|nr:hypothetical protein HDU96_007805 [Phlyctochytrium bullatum]